MSTSILTTFSQAFSVFEEFHQRQRGTLGPRLTAVILVAMTDPGCRSYSRGMRVVHDALASGADLCDLHATTTPSRAAFSQARRKLKPAILRDGFRQIRQQCSAARSLGDGLLHKYRRIGIDGTHLTLRVSDELVDAFGYHGNQEGMSAVPLASLVLLWDISANQPVDWVLGPASLSEREASFTLCDNLGPDDVLIADRGYPSFEFFHALLNRGTNFIIRMNTTTIAVAKELKEFLESNEDDAIIECSPMGARSHRRFPGDVSMRLRLVRDRKHGDRVIATNLVDPVITRDEILDAYCSRWNVETAIREAKEWRGLEDFRAEYEDGIHQEVAALMIHLYLVGEMEVEMKILVHQRVAEGLEDPSALTDMPYTFNRCLMGIIAVNMLVTAIAGGDLEGVWRRGKAHLWIERSRKRKNRSYLRRSKSPHGKWRKTGPYRTRR